uniref:Cathepsin propeptide inhibitor domain-containing protein n=1 Tax=Oryza punctata TaxID=4537 RepID=A0A0E0LQF7_ORYPU
MASMMLLRAFRHVAASASGGADRLLGTRPYRATIPKRVNFVVEDEDVASKEALWSLYERWCKAFDEERDHDEMLRRFDHFKNFVLFVRSANKEAIRDGRSIRHEVNIFADGKVRELQGYYAINDLYELPYAQGCGGSCESASIPHST